MATADSIGRFVVKLNGLTAQWPEVKDEARYRLIVDNVSQALVTFHVTVDPRWDGIIYLNGQDPASDTFPWGREYNGGDETY